MTVPYDRPRVVNPETRRRMTAAEFFRYHPFVWGVLVFTVLCVVGLTGGFFLTMAQQKTDGFHVGYVTAVEHAGVIWTTTTAYIKTDTESTQEDSYCVRDPSVAEELVRLSVSGERVRVHYVRDRVFVAHWHCEIGQSIIVSVALAEARP